MRDSVDTGSGPDPRRVHDPDGLVRELGLLRIRAARGRGRGRVSLNDIATSTAIPRSTVHAYLSGGRMPPADSLDAMVVALGATPAEQREWAEALYRAVAVAGRASAPDRSGTPRTAVPVPRQLPAAPRGFVGREAETAELERVLADSDGVSPLLAVIGTGGVGKTALVLHWAHRNLARFPDGQLWIDLRGFGALPPMAAGDALDRLLRAIGAGNAALPADVDARSAALRTALADRRMLLVLDNARSAGQVMPLLPAAPGVVTVVTSRDTLRPLVAAVGADRVRVDRLAEAESLSLLANASRTGGIAEAAVAARIARHCEGLPLALRIVRERLSVTAEAEIACFADELDRDHQHRLAALDLHDASLEVSVRSAFGWSYRALPAEAAVLFRRLPLCLLTTFDRADAEVLLEHPDSAGRLLDTLVAASLLDTAGPDRYRLHELVAGFALERLAAEESPAEISRLRLDFGRHLARMAEAALGWWDAQRPPRIDFPAGDPSRPIDVVRTLPTPELAEEWIAGHIDAIAATVQELAASAQPGYSWVLAERGSRSLWATADTQVMDPALRCARDAALAAGEPRAAIVMCRLLGVSHGRRGQLDAAEAMFTQGLRIAEGHGARDLAVLDRANLGLIRGMRGDVAAAVTALAGVIDELYELGESPISTLHSLAEFELQRGDVAAASAWTRQMLADPHVRHGRASTPFLDASMMAAAVALAAGDRQAAHATLDEVDALLAEVGGRVATCQCLTLRGRIFLDSGDLAAADRCGQQAVTLARALAGRSEEIAAQCLLGEVARQRGELVSADRCLTDALARAREAQLRYAEAEALVLLAKTCQAAGDSARLRRVLSQAREITARCGFLGLAREIETVAPAA
ncbi:MAG TPA: NB-ARC domain-containing protein [Jatrophihabitans sp.]|nr:NB-ARC domain-containing protein [Jatrophihabitans sp.]